VKDTAKLLSVLLPVKKAAPERYAAAAKELSEAKNELVYMLASNEAAKAARNAADAITAFAEVRAGLCLGEAETVRAFYGGGDYSAAKAVITAYGAVKRLYVPQERFAVTEQVDNDNLAKGFVQEDRSVLSLLDTESRGFFNEVQYKLAFIVGFVKDQIEDLRKQKRFKALMENTGNFYRAAAGGF
jgi:hypothetical protein